MESIKYYRFLLSLSLSLSLVTGTGLNELQIAFVCREILKVHTFILMHIKYVYDD